MEGASTAQDQSQEAVTSSFDPRNEIKLDLASTEWLVLPGLLSSGQCFHKQWAQEAQQRKAEEQWSSRKRRRRKEDKLKKREQ